MLRTVLLILALLVLIAIGLVWMGVFGLSQKEDGTLDVTANTVEVRQGERQITVPVPEVHTTPPANPAQPQPQQTAPAPATQPQAQPAPAPQPRP